LPHRTSENNKSPSALHAYCLTLVEPLNQPAELVDPLTPPLVPRKAATAVDAVGVAVCTGIDDAGNEKNAVPAGLVKKGRPITPFGNSTHTGE